jgi:TM2 domain-containing membrane protein YozV
MENTKYIVPAIISAFIPGLGQIVKGEFIKGLLIMIVGGVVGFLLAWTFIVPILIWMWNVYDAFTSNGERAILEDKSRRVGF